MTEGSQQDIRMNIPSEVAWKLVATSRRLLEEERLPSGASLSIFTYVPRLKTLNTDYPNDRLVYFKISVSLASDVTATSGQTREARLLIGGGLPIWTSILDLRISPTPEAIGDFRPYFIAASPIRRTMLETGVVGDNVFEGETEGLAIGKSGSQIHETYRTATQTTSKTSGFSLFGLGGVSGSTSTTSATGQRDVVQFSDNTTREASEERRELFSHLTNVNNVLTLLSAQGIGTPYLRFTLYPRPLRQLTIDPTDSTFWFSELLRRRSNGIEGIQDFYAIGVVPRNVKQFCLYTTLRNVYVLDNVPAPPDRLWDIQPDHLPLYFDYLNQKYPPGSPIEQLDVDITQQVVDDRLKDMFQPVVEGWDVVPIPDAKRGHVRVLIRGIVKGPPGPSTTFTLAVYKTIQEVNLEMRLAQYQKDLATSPLQRGRAFFIPLSLAICFDMDKAGKMTAKDDSLQGELGSPQKTPIGNLVNVPRMILSSSARSSRLEDIVQSSILIWNALENQVISQLSSVGDWGSSELSFDDPIVQTVWLRALEALEPNDPLNESLKQAASWLGLVE